MEIGMKKFLSVILVLIISLCGAFALVGCSKNESQKFDMVFITDGGTISDGAYNQSAWNGVKEYAETSNMSYRYYQPNLDENGELDADTVGNYIKLAVDGNAKYIVMQGDNMATAVDKFAPQYENVKFLLVDAYPHSEDSDTADTFSNVMTVSFDTLQAGFLAGYTSVIKGYNKIGYLGSVSDSSSASYGAGFVQGVAKVADENGTPVYCDYANYDAENLNYDYSFTIRPVYQKVSDSKETTYKVNVVGGIGSGVYADGENVTVTANNPDKGKAFDHWEVKSDTEGVKDKKVNISSDKKSSMNLLVGDCDCTITAVYKDVDTVAINVINKNDSSIYNTYNVEKDSTTSVTAPAADSGMVFDHWECDDETTVEDVNSASTNVTVKSGDVAVTPIYVKSDTPTFDVTVENGSGSGSYRSGDQISVVADPPKDGYMFYKWENVDSQGLSTGIAMSNEYCYTTDFEMIDRYSSIAETMYDNGTQVIFGGGNSQADSIFTATWKISHQVYGFGYGYDQSSMDNCLSSVVTDYRVAVINALKDYKGGTQYEGNCSNNCLYVVDMSTQKTYKDNDGNEVDDKNYNEKYANVFNELANGTIKINSPTDDIRTVVNSKCMTLNYWVK